MNKECKNCKHRVWLFGWCCDVDNFLNFYVSHGYMCSLYDPKLVKVVKK